ncbi:DUF2586 domain-containing protein [Halodesulfovibrio sp. MK-HDV]|uniref:DUF2586 domain-containing protein n=1 Tax=Halodesulfovibrio sp. MK-HDV TaxID=2599925 RepID=UPI00136CEC63|nr:DUF2586 domain-containing protein [Halodesulfovibrio sp. MK-HDV]KAF1073429.1 hypothetical protein MKHDV_03627 [Halodesulfovibrio sp. MK-HDV]
MGRKDVFEHIVDGVSGLVPGDVTGKALVVGVCSQGEVGKVYYLGKRSDLTKLLGAGPLVDRLNDIFAAAGQDATVLAVPVSGNPSGTISRVKHVGTGVSASVSGLPAANADVLVEIVNGGSLGTATAKVSTDAGASFGSASAVAANGQIAIGGSGTTLVLESGNLVVGDTYSYTVRGSIGAIQQTGKGASVSVEGAVKVGAQLALQVVKSGGRNVGQYRLSVDGGDNFSGYRTIPVDGRITAADTGTTIVCPDDEFTVGTTYSCSLLAPVPTVSAVIAALKKPLEIVDPEYVYVVGASDSVAWASLGALADDLWNKHRPTFFLCESRLPSAGEDLDDWVSALKEERATFAHRFVSVCCGFGEIADRTGQRKVRNAGGLLSGRILSIPVQRDIGRVRDQSITGITVPDEYTESMQLALEDAGYITLTRYAGLRGTYWGTARTMADTTSDYQRLEVIRTTFKAIRLMRLQALKALKDELGDPVQGADASGLAYLRSNLENALDTMVKAKPKELAGYAIEIPLDQDFVNNGVAVETKLIGIPIIDKINLYSSYIYAGSKFDPRLQG